MSWTTPMIVETRLGMEINCYACAEMADTQPGIAAPEDGDD